MLHIQTNRKTKRTAKRGRREKRRVIVEFAVIFTGKMKLFISNRLGLSREKQIDY
jgi:hypothetical protein